MLLPKFAPVTIAALLATLVLIFAFQADNITGRLFHVVLIAIPITLQVYLNAGLAYGLMKWLKVEHSVAAPGALIGASNFFELAVATAIALFGPESGRGAGNGGRRSGRSAGDAVGLRGLQPHPALVSCGASELIMKKRVLILCTGNSARSQMAEGLLRHDAGERFDVESAGTKPGIVRPEAIAAMQELGIDISGHRSKHVDEFDGQQFDYTSLPSATTPKRAARCSSATVKKLHHSFDDPPPTSVGTDAERMAIFRRVRDELRAYLRDFAQSVN